MAAPEKPATDWERIEAEYRAGQLSVSEISRQFGPITEGAIRKRAKRDGWQRDLSEQVRRAARSEAVRAQVRTDLSREPADDAEIVSAAATRGAKAIEGHLARAERIKALADKLTTELERYMRGEPTSVSIFVAKADSPATIIRTLADTAERVQKIERQALNLDDPEADKGSGKVNSPVIILPANGRD